MLVPPVGPGAGGRPVPGATAGGVGTRGQPPSTPAATLWPLAPAQAHVHNGHSQGTPPLAATPAPAHNQGVSRYGLYSLFPGGGGGSYVAATPSTPGPTSTRAYHATTHKVSESVFSAAVGVGVSGGYTWGAPTPPPGSPYSPVPATQLELLAKNLASLGPPAQQALSLQSVGMNIGSLHHAQHTQHTQHTLNLSGLHHLHHGGLHQGTFSPQLSLVTGNAPTLTINSFSSPNSTSNVVPTTGVLLQEYQPSTPSSTSCPTSVCASSGPTTNVSTMVVQGGCSIQSTTKRREAFLPSQGQPVKLENKTRQPCVCRNSNGKTRLVHSDAGCSRTLPVITSWSSQDVSSNSTSGTATSLVKKEPMTSVPCQVAEVSTSLHATTTAVKIEPVLPKTENGMVVSNTGASGIPVGIAVARQRLQHQETSSSTRNVSLSHHTSHHASYHHFQPDSMGSAAAMTVGGATLVHCGGGGDDRPAHLTLPSNGLPAALNSTLGSIGATATATAWPPTLWQYPAAAMPMEPVGFPQMGVGLQGGLQLVRDPSSGHLLLIHAAEQMQQAVVWPNYPNHNGSNVGPPPLLLPPPPPSLQLLSDIGGARLVLTEKRKHQNNLPIVKIEADCNSPTTIITSAESTKALQTVTSMTGTLVPDAPLLTTLHYYPHTPALVQISQAEPTHCRSQATSPVSCLTPPPETTTIHAIEPPEVTPIGVQDASNQTDAQEAEYDPPMNEHIVKQEQNASPCHLQTNGLTSFEVVPSPEKMCNIVRITNVNSSICNVVGKLEKTENTIANKTSDCPKYALSPIKECRSISSVDRTIEHVVNCHSEEDRIPEIRTGPKIIELTEENCDSFHENLEFFSRRRDHERPVKNIDSGRLPEEQRHKIREISSSNHHEAEVELTDVSQRIEGPNFTINEVPDYREVLQQNDDEKVSDLTVTRIQAVEVIEKLVVQERVKCSKSVTSLETLIRSPRKSATCADANVKSFDMPSIECDEVIVKQEKELADCPYSQKVQSVIEKPKIYGKTYEVTKRQSGEKFHPGIENVVEKLKKKNAAAALQDVHRMEEAGKDIVHEGSDAHRDINGSENPRGQILENGVMAGDHFGYDPQLVDRDNNEQGLFQHRDHFQITDDHLEKSGNSDLQSPVKYTASCVYNFNNNKEEALIFKPVAVDSVILKREDRTSPSDTNLPSENNISSTGNTDQIEAVLHEDVDSSEQNQQKVNCESKSPNIKQKPLVDLSGLELLSNSIEQFEHLKPEAQTSQNLLDSDFERSPTKLKLLTSQSESNNNNVDSPLGLLCALAEQRFREEVGDEVPKRICSYDNPEEVSQAGRLLLNLGKMNLEKERKRLEKRKHSEDTYFYDSKRLREDISRKPEDTLHRYERSGRDRRYSEPAEGDPEKSRRNMNFSGRNGNFEEYSTEEDNVHECSDIDKCPQSMEFPYPVDVFDHEKNGLEEEYNRTCEYHSGKEDYREEVLRQNGYTDSETENSMTEHYYEKKVGQPLDSMPFGKGFLTKVDLSNGDSHEAHHKYRSREAQLEAKKFIARKGQVDNDSDFPNMDAMELDMRIRLAEIQRQYKEKQKELSKLTPKKDDKKGPGRPRKKSHSSSSECGTFSSPPILETVGPLQKSPTRSSEVAPPPVTSAVLAMPRCNVNLVKLGEPRSHIKLLDSIPSIPIAVPTVASPITVLPTNKILQEEDDKSATRLGYDTSSPAPTTASSSSASKKRKVGRPRKLMCASGSVRHLTETIVAKKPKSKSSLVGYLLAAKNRHFQNKFISKTGYTPLPFKSGISTSKATGKSHKTPKKHDKPKAKPVKQTPLHNKSVISSIIAEKEKFSCDAKLEKQLSKVKPKLKAEAKVKTWEEDLENAEWNSVAENETPEVTLTVEPCREKSAEPEKPDKEKHEKSKKKKRKSCSASPKRRKSSDREHKESKRRKSIECKECAKAAKAEKNSENMINRCKLTSAHLAIDQLRVLTAMGGLFYAGRLSAVRAPDVYAITLDGERGNRPHIHPREEILKDAIVEVCPSSTKELPPGTRLCAYWSQQYRCLYPGTSVEPAEPDPELDEKFVSVEFDDGDSGRIALDDIRLLQPDYPVVASKFAQTRSCLFHSTEYDPNPLLTLGKRRRQTSVSNEEKRLSTGSQPVVSNSSASTVDAKQADQQKPGDLDSKTMEAYRERKRMKKRRRDKLKRLHEAQEGKRKHRKHKCCDEHRKHKHRKHRKHKHKHSHHTSHSEGSNLSGGESCSGQKSEEEITSPDEANVKAQEDEPEVVKLAETNQPAPEPVVQPVLEEKTDKVKKSDKKAKTRERQESVESRSKMAAFLPARQLWGWSGKGYRRPGAKGRAKKQFFRAIQRGSETIQIGDSAVFLSTGRPDRPYIGRIESMWETSSSNMIVKVKWFYHPEETVGCPSTLKYPGALFESPHMDENDVQTISHKCEVLPLQQYTEKLGKEPHRYLTIYDNNDIYYLAGYYDPTTHLLTMQPGVV